MAATATNPKEAPSIDPDELAKFRAMAEEWWDPDGKFRPLHKFNPVRLKYIRDQACAHFERDTASLTPLSGLTVLDVGCGGGLLCEPLARLGAAVTGIDAVARNIEIARIHAETTAVSIEYRTATVEELAAEDRQFDIVLNMEVVEHVGDVDAFLGACGAVVADGGMMFFATLNRTAKAFALAIVGGEYILRWLPQGAFADLEEVLLEVDPGAIRAAEIIHSWWAGEDPELRERAVWVGKLLRVTVASEEVESE